MYTPVQFENTRREIRALRQENATLKRFHQFQKQKADILEEENHTLRKENDQLKKERQKLEEELENTKRERDAYKGMVFKSKRSCSRPEEHRSGKIRGGQNGHKGVSRTKPETINHHVHAYVTHCPTCDNPLSHTESVDTHTVTDIPHWSEFQTQTTEYSIERQWCSNCHKEVRAQPVGVIPRSRFGMNLFTCVLVWKYRFRDPINKIAERLFTHYQLRVSEAELVLLLKRGKKYLGWMYDEILREVRGSPVKHGDETGWRVNGENWWCWGAVNDKSVYYTIEETRGGGIAQDIFEGSRGVLVRDDYAGYEKVKGDQQSCWTHALRVSHDEAHRETASAEVQKLHKTLKDLFDLLSEDIQTPFDIKERHVLYEWYTKDIEKIMSTTYEPKDAKKVQTRIRNQYTNLLTALLHEGVPLTNNAAERAMRAMVVTRKISGGSKTKDGAKTHAVNMSVVETIVKRNLPLLDTLQEYLLKGAAGKS